jgi:hypothetical protein
VWKKWHTRTRSTHVSSRSACSRRTSHWKEDCNHEPPNYWLAWAKTMLPVINRSVRDARAQLQTGHQDLHSYFSQVTVATPRTPHQHADSNELSSSKRAPPGHPAALSERTKQTRMATLSSDIRQYFPGIADDSTYPLKQHWTSTNNHVCARIDKPQNRSRDYTCRRAGSVEPFLRGRRESRLLSCIPSLTDIS